MLRMRDLLRPKPKLQEGDPTEWQSELLRELESDPDDRQVIFVVDPEGGKGKTWLIGYYYTKYEDSQILGIGRRDDLAHAVDPTKRVFFLNVPRGHMERLQYGFLEQLKDRQVFSPKYDSRTKIMRHKVHVVVMCNEFPDLKAMTADRYNIKTI